jgi:Protein of unknown function (DUF732)
MNRKQRITAAIAGAIAVAGVVGVATRDAPEPQPAPAVSPSLTPNTDDVFLRAVRVEFPNAPADSTIRVGRGYCSLFDSGVTLQTILDGVEPGDRYLAGYIAGAAIVQFCPQHADQLD